MTNVDYKRAVETRRRSLKEQVAVFTAKLLGVQYA